MTATDHAVELIRAAALAASDKLATNLLAFDVSEQLAITDAFLLASGANDRQVKTIVETVEENLEIEHDVKPLRIEGLGERRWVLMDYGDFWVHVFHRETREFYDLERLWADVERVDVAAIS